MPTARRISVYRFQIVHVKSLRPESTTTRRITPRLPLTDSNVHGLYGGRRLEVLRLSTIPISDTALLRLLGIDMRPGRNDYPCSHALTELYLWNCYEVTCKSGLQECGRLKTLDLSTCHVATADLLQGNDEWPCSHTLLTLGVHVQPREHSNREGEKQQTTPPLTEKEQGQARDRLRADGTSPAAVSGGLRAGLACGGGLNIPKGAEEWQD